MLQFRLVRKITAWTTRLIIAMGIQVQNSEQSSMIEKNC